MYRNIKIHCQGLELLPPSSPSCNLVHTGLQIYQANISLKWQCHGIFWHFFLYETNPPEPLINRLKWFCRKIHFRGDICEISDSARANTVRSQTIFFVAFEHLHLKLKIQISPQKRIFQQNHYSLLIRGHTRGVRFMTKNMPTNLVTLPLQEINFSQNVARINIDNIQTRTYSLVLHLL